MARDDLGWFCQPGYCPFSIARPVPRVEVLEGYDAGSAVRLAENLEGDLLLLHGMRDDNVHPSNTFQMAAKLQDRDIPFEMIMFPTATHGIGSAAYRSGKWSFLQKHLDGAATANEKP